MGLSTEEQETIIQIDRNGNKARIYSSNTLVLARLAKKGNEYQRISVDRMNGEIVAAAYEFDKHLLTLRNKRTSRNMTDEQRQAARERMQNLWAARKER